MFLKITQANGTYVLIPLNYVTNISLDIDNRITGVEYLDAAAAAAPVTVVVTGITRSSVIKYDVGMLAHGPVFHAMLSNN
jgi:hypothetical protein